MKMRDLTRQAGSMTVPAWPPPGWAAVSYHPGAALPAPSDGVLTSFTHPTDTNVFRLAMRFEANDYLGLLAWHGAPMAAAVEHLLTASLGQEIRAIGDLDVEP